MDSDQKRSPRVKQGSWQVQTRAMLGSLLVIALLGLLSWLCLIQSSEVSSAEYRIWQKELGIDLLQRKNAESLAEVTEMLSGSRLEGRALELDYVFAEERRYLDVPGYPLGGSGEGLMAASRMDSGAILAPEQPRSEPLSVARWWEKVVAQFATWARVKP